MCFIIILLSDSFWLKSSISFKTQSRLLREKAWHTIHKFQGREVKVEAVIACVCVCVCVVSLFICVFPPIIQHPWTWMRALAQTKEDPTTLSRSRVASGRSWGSTVTASGCQSCLRSTESCTNRTCPPRPSKTWRPGRTYALYVLCMFLQSLNIFQLWGTV